MGVCFRRSFTGFRTPVSGKKSLSRLSEEDQNSRTPWKSRATRHTRRESKTRLLRGCDVLYGERKRCWSESWLGCSGVFGVVRPGASGACGQHDAITLHTRRFVQGPVRGNERSKRDRFEAQQLEERFKKGLPASFCTVHHRVSR